MTSSRPDPLARARDLAFAGRLRAAELALDRARDRAPLEARWLRSYIWAARGRFTDAGREARAVLRRATDPSLRARAAATLGSVLRQTGRHAEARVVESEGVRTAPTPLARAHLLVGLAADAVGLGELRDVDRALERLAAIRSRDPRLAVRIRWVRCERELLAGSPERAVKWARRALAISRREGAQRHIAKSLLFLGASHMEAARRAERPTAARSVARAHEALREARALARRIGADPVARVAGDLLGRGSGGR